MSDTPKDTNTNIESTVPEDPTKEASSSNGSSEPVSEPQGLDEFEAEVRAKLSSLIEDAKACRDKAVELVERAKPFQMVRNSLLTIAQGDHPQVKLMLQRQRELSSERVERMSAVSSGMQRDVELQQETFDALEHECSNLQPTKYQPAKQWVRAIEQERRECRENVDSRHEWLDEAEKRWGNDTTEELQEM